jgi:hypothetical protein
MDLQQPQTPTSITQTSAAETCSYEKLIQEIGKTLERDDKKKEANRNELKQLLLAFNDKLNDASNPILINVTALKNIENLQITTEQLQKQNKELVEKIKKLSQNSGSSDSATIILQCVAFIGLIALTITAMIIQANNGCA